MGKQEYEFHPYASVVPMLGQTELNALAADIQGSGLRDDITLLDGMILDGRNRYRACLLTGIEPRFQEFNGNGDPIAFIVSKNLCRRQLTASQKALAVAKISQLPRGNPNLKTAKTPINPKSAQVRNSKTVEQVAKEIEVSPRTVEQAKQVLRESPKETVEAVEQGKKSVATAVKEIKKSKEEKNRGKHFDKTGYPIPESILEDWHEAESLSEVLSQLHRIKLRIEKSVEKSDLAFREITNSTVADLENVWRDLQRVIPYAVCTTCQGRTRKNCTLCKQRGWISKFGYEHWPTKAARELRQKAVQK